jgi:hypothetical protein
MDLKIYKNFWKHHIRPWSGLPLFPRDMSSRESPTTIIGGKTVPTPLNRKSFLNEKQYLTSVGKFFQERDYYIQVFSDWQIRHRIYDTIFFEIDVHPEGKKQFDKLEDAVPIMLETKEVIDIILDGLGIAYRCFFTGGRGFHYYLDFEPTFIVDYKTTAIKFLNDIGILGIIDSAVVEPARIARLPYTKHLKCGGYSIYTNGANAEDIIRSSNNNEVLMAPVINLRKTTILDYLDVDAEPPKRVEVPDYVGKYDGILPECVLRIMKKILVDQHAVHEERIHLAGYLKRFNYDDSEIVEYFRNTSDFQYDFAMEQIASISNNGHYSCRKVRQILPDLCPGVCEYIRVFARRRDDEGT